ncbi:MAG: hypothetical protein ACRELY_21870, partial [Polyangiaceae bacterium]
GVCCTYSLPVFADESGASGLPPLSDAPQGPTVVIDDSSSATPVLAAGAAPIGKDEPVATPPQKKNPWATVHKTEAFLATAYEGGSSSWPGDPVALSELRLGFRFMETGALYVQSGIGYAPVNNRELVQIALGGQLWLRLWKVKPFVRAAVIHQHEESTAAWKSDFGESLLGIGNGIRHRAGAEGALGVDIPFYRGDKVEVDGSVEMSAPWYPDNRGPHFYLLGGLGLGIHYAL